MACSCEDARKDRYGALDFTRDRTQLAVSDGFAELFVDVIGASVAHFGSGLVEGKAKAGCFPKRKRRTVGR